jgi:rRNA maturation endonuclease Nob1
MADQKQCLHCGHLADPRHTFCPDCGHELIWKPKEQKKKES